MARFIVRLRTDTDLSTQAATQQIQALAGVTDAVPARTTNAVTVVVPDDQAAAMREELAGLDFVDAVFDDIQGVPQVASEALREEFFRTVREARATEELPSTLETEPRRRSRGDGEGEGDGDARTDGGTTIPDLSPGERAAEGEVGPIEDADASVAFANAPALHDQGITGKSVIAVNLDSVPGYEPVVVRDEDDNYDIIPIEELVSFGSPIFTENGEEVVEATKFSVLTGGQSASRDPRWVSVKRVIRHPFDGTLSRITTHTGVVDITKNHSLFRRSVGGGSKRPDGGKIRSNKAKGKHSTLADAGDISEGDVIDMAVPNRTTTIQSQSRTPTEIFAGNDDLAWLLGFFVGDGCAYVKSATGRFEWKLTNKNIDDLKKAKRILDNQFPGTYKIYEEGAYYELTSGHSAVGEWFAEQCYTSRGKKRVPKTILNSRMSIRKSFLAGYNLADGDTSKNNKFTCFTTNSRTLAMGLVWLLRGFGREYNIVTRDDKPRVVQIFINGKSGVARRSDPWVVKDVTDVDYSGYVYDLSTENEEFGAGVGPVRAHNTGVCEFQFAASRRLDGVDLTGNDDPWADPAGHGSYTMGMFAGGSETAGVERGFVPGADVFPIRSTLAGSEIIQAQDIIVNLAESTGRPVIVNNSIGFEQCTGLCDHPVTDAVRTAASHPQVIQVWAAGNQGGDCGQDCSDTGISGPNSIDEVITVGATGHDGNPDALHGYSSRGGQDASCGSNKPDVTAPIFGWVPWACDRINVENGGGTSGACPQVAGTVALMVDAIGEMRGVDAAAEAIEQTARQFQGSGWNGCTGHGNVDSAAAADAFGEIIPRADRGSLGVVVAGAFSGLAPVALQEARRR